MKRNTKEIGERRVREPLFFPVGILFCTHYCDSFPDLDNDVRNGCRSLLAHRVLMKVVMLGSL